MENEADMIGALKRRLTAGRRPAVADVAQDPSARFAYDLATKPPTKNVASVKAASDVFEANRQADLDPPSSTGDEKPGSA